MRRHLADEEIPYTGLELRSHWILETWGIAGDAIAAFIGPCETPIEHMVDLADVAAGEGIRARLMLHFIIERFDNDLEKAVLLQRLLVALAQELLASKDACATDGERPLARQDCLAHETACDVRRRGDDLFVGDRKLSVSIATASPVSTLIHLGINVDPEGAPVAAIGLDELGVDAREFARKLMAGFADEVADVRSARCKVRPVP